MIGGLQLRISNHQGLGCYDFNSWSAITFKELLSEFVALVEESKTVAKASLQEA